MLGYIKYTAQRGVWELSSLSLLSPLLGFPFASRHGHSPKKEGCSRGKNCANDVLFPEILKDAINHKNGDLMN